MARIPRIVAGLDAGGAERRRQWTKPALPLSVCSLCASPLSSDRPPKRVFESTAGDLKEITQKCANRLDFAICRGIADRKTAMVYSPQLGVPQILDSGLLDLERGAP